jgi:hypothetical protein
MCRGITAVKDKIYMTGELAKIIFKVKRRLIQKAKKKKKYNMTQK